MKTIRITSLLLAALFASCAGPVQNGSYGYYGTQNARYSGGSRSLQVPAAAAPLPMQMTAVP
ncbi:MAG: hypothetical protein NTY98_04960 [Verrucomicrobia bacterium]|nr:hypothetical protein [Verrucomicrobiota bacterium]